jgi:hypothetical protein
MLLQVDQVQPWQQWRWPGRVQKASRSGREMERLCPNPDWGGGGAAGAWEMLAEGALPLAMQPPQPTIAPAAALAC